ncbi:MAG: fasciclin domain-containing protein [Actinobacteria bacterium]|nr:fasciclin domain-containing protein [Actinomycetota bacterium]
MYRTRSFARAAAALAVVGALSVPVVGVGTAGAQSSGSSTSTSAAASKTIVDIAASNPNFSTLVAAVQAAGLAPTLSGAGPFTVFAPTNEAFAKIPKADLDAILADKAKLAAILTYHVVPGEVLSTDLKKKQKVETVEGNKVLIKVSKKKGATIDGAQIVQTDIQGSNGVIHVIDTVILPPDDSGK